jgi:hypothetical protein
MTAIDALKTAWTFGIRVDIDGTDLVLDAPAAPPDDVLDLLRQHKLGILELLRARDDVWSTEDWQAHFEERAAIGEFDGGLSRREAEALAFKCCIVTWLNHNPLRSTPGACLACGGVDQAHDRLLPFGAEPPGHVWLHSECWPDWYRERQSQAIAALAEMGIQSGNEDAAGLGEAQ